MLPTTDDINGAFVTDNSLEHEQENNEEEQELFDEDDAKGNGNNEFETNMSENIEENADNVDNVENLEVINAGEEVIDNLNKYSLELSSSANNAGYGDGGMEEVPEYNEEFDNDNRVAVLRNRERENAFSSDDDDDDNDDEDTGATNATEMHPTFNDEWGNLNEDVKYDVFSNDITEEDIDEKFNGKPYDLSHDIDVNNAANLPINPDAVFINGYRPNNPTNYMPRFEKLSLNNSPPTK